MSKRTYKSVKFESLDHVLEDEDPSFFEDLYKYRIGGNEFEDAEIEIYYNKFVWKNGIWKNGIFSALPFNTIIWEDGIWLNGEEAEWKDKCIWIKGKILYNGKLVDSNKSPNEFLTFHSMASSLKTNQLDLPKELRQIKNEVLYNIADKLVRL